MATVTSAARPLAIVTGASSGIGLELARLCARNDFDLVIAADRPLDAAVEDLSAVLAERHRKMAEPGSAHDSAK